MNEVPMFQMSPDTRLLRQTMAKVSVGQTVTYETLSAAISKPVSSSSAALQSARNSLLRKEHMVFGVIRGVGLKRLDDTDIVNASEQDVVGMRRKAKRAVRKLTSISDYNALPPEKRLAHTARVSVFTAMADMLTDRSLEHVEKAAVGHSSQLPFNETIRAFLS